MERRTAGAPSVIPHRWYADQGAAIALLQRALGFALHFTAPEPGGGVHAELRIGHGFVMVGPRHSAGHGFATPRELGHVNTGAVHIATPDVQALYRRATESGAEVVAPLHDTDWASRDFTLRDAEGYVWHLGTYHPAIDDRARPSEAEVFCALRYERAGPALRWLCDAFGAADHRVIRGEGDEVAHGLLRFGSSLLLVSSARADDPLRLRPPQRVGGAHTQVVYCVVGDPRAPTIPGRRARARRSSSPRPSCHGARTSTWRATSRVTCGASRHTARPRRSPGVSGGGTCAAGPGLRGMPWRPPRLWHHRVVPADLWTVNLGVVEYREAHDLQERVRAARRAGTVPDTLLLLEHPPVYTRGRRSAPGELGMGEDWYRAQGIDIVDVDRGGKVTYHGPGQLVGYPIVGVDDVMDYVATLERAIVAALDDEGVAARGRSHEGIAWTGVWVEDRKLASIGLHVSQGVSKHGFAVNVDNSLEPFGWIVPCGLPEVRMTSIAVESGAPAPHMPCFRKRMAWRFAQAHGSRQRLVSRARLEAALGAVAAGAV